MCFQQGILAAGGDGQVRCLSQRVWAFWGELLGADGFAGCITARCCCTWLLQSPRGLASRGSPAPLSERDGKHWRWGKAFGACTPDPKRLVTCGEPQWLWGVQVPVLGSAAAPQPRNTPGTEQEHGSPQPPAAQPLPCCGRKPSARRMLHVGWEGWGHAGAACGAEPAGTMAGKTQGQGVPAPGRHILFSQGKPLCSPPALHGAEAETQRRHGAVGRPVVGVGSVRPSR